MSSITKENIDKCDKPISNPLKAIRKKCLQCSCENMVEVANCTVESCALYPFRFGKNPYRAKRVMTEDEKKALSERLKSARINKEKNN